MSQDQRHLSAEQIEYLLDATLGGPDGDGQSELVRNARRHLAGCEACQRLFSMHEGFNSALQKLKQAEPASGKNECFSGNSFNELFAGLVHGKEAEALVTHASQCDHCGALLREAAETFGAQESEEEEASMVALQSSKAEWQAALAQQLASVTARDSNKPSPSGFSLRRIRWMQGVPQWMYAAAAVVLLASVATSVAVWHSRPGYTNGLLAEAYTEHRTLEVRIPSAKYGPMRVERGAGASSLDRPPSLLRAEALISESLRKNPNDPMWLQAKARADLLDGNYESAIKSLQRALENQPESPSLLTDLASAYFERAEAADRPIDYGNAIESLSRALAKSPDEPIALFNRALACERMFLYTQAIDDWEQYLRADPKGPWAEDARRRLAALKQRVELHEGYVGVSLLEVNTIAQVHADDASTPAKIDDRIEEYLHTAIADWLPRAYPEKVQDAASTRDFREALRVLSEITLKNHGDRWLADVLASASSPGFPLAIAEISSSIKSNDTGDNVAARQHASAAERLFTSMRQTAGALRAHVEYIFASHDAQEGTECIRAAEDLDRRLGGPPYVWLRIQADIEQGTCSWFVGNFGAARERYEKAEREAKSSGYKAIFLRTQDHLSALSTEIGDFPGGAKRTQVALSNFWSGRYPAMRGYNLYFNVYEASRLTDRPHLQVAAWRDGLALSELFTDNVLRAMAHSAMADAAVSAGMASLAEKEFSKTGELFAASQQIKSTRTARIEAETRLAAVEASQGRAQEAVLRLRRFAAEVSSSSDNFLQILYYTTMGDAESRIGDDKDAGSDLRTAVALANSQLQTLSDDKARIDWESRTSNAYRDYVQLLLRQGFGQTALEIWELYRGAAAGAGKRKRSTPYLPPNSLEEPREVAARLPSLTDETVVSYAVLPGGLAIWVYDNRGVSVHWTEEKDGVVGTLADRLRRLCSDPHSDLGALRRDARAVYDLLVLPVEVKLSSGRILAIELDDRLAGLPFEALMDSRGRYASDLAPAFVSLGVYYHHDGRAMSRVSKDSRALVVGVSSSSALGGVSAPPLPDADSESEMVSGVFPSSQLLLSRDASAAAVVSRLSSASVFHFAGHAFSSHGLSGLLLSDSLLTAESLHHVPLSRMRIAVLSACSTQGGSDGAAYDSDGLVRIFLRAGVPDVVASRWNVDSVAARHFMDFFYRALLAGDSPPEAIHRAQAVLRSVSGTEHPYYWSAFGSFGLV